MSFALLFLIASHLVPSRPAIRMSLIGVAGRPAFYAGYSLVSFLALAAVITAYRSVESDLWLWVPLYEGRYVALALMPLALFLLVCRFTQRPSAWASFGIYRITSTPGSLAVLIWSLVHLLNVGEARTVLVFVGMAVIAVAAIARNARNTEHGLLGVVPFARILLGRERFDFWEIRIWRVVAALALTKLVLLLHPLVIGVDPLAGL
nr:NnrU family protein [Azospirillum sp. SYSU D00513]